MIRDSWRLNKTKFQVQETRQITSNQSKGNYVLKGANIQSQEMEASVNRPIGGSWLDAGPQRDWVGLSPSRATACLWSHCEAKSQSHAAPKPSTPQLMWILPRRCFLLTCGLIFSFLNFIQGNLKSNHCIIMLHFCYAFPYSFSWKSLLDICRLPVFVNCQHILINCCLVSSLSSLHP